ncbi:MAG: hypothetical protein H6573_03810 [Lewinellaceae bacterium]|nr:hypothetical protein [Phaeodactylibacter sp.]MCB0616037.1 hypothetical protein [Phaeodactylibacter sp.]MCB9346622.1 hypothetical protein [Lewinellaceae bacterium]
MSQRSFFIQLSILSLGTAILLFFLNRLPQLQAYSTLSWISLAAFAALCILMYLAGYQAVMSDNKNNFSNAVLGFTAAKMFLAILVIFGYSQLAQPPDKLFIIPFFAIYLIYTIFETYFMMKLGRMNA